VDSNPSVAPGHGFALLSLPLNHGQVEARRVLNLGDGYSYSPILPLAMPSHWRDWVGSIRLEGLEHSSVHLVVTAPTGEGGPVAQDLHTKVYRFYLGLLITTDFVAHTRGTLLVGSTPDDGPDVETLTEYEATYFVPGAPEALLNEHKVRHARRLAQAIADIYARGTYERFGRVLRCFLGCLRSTSYDDRIHQSVRCVEGFVHPGRQYIKKAFTERAQFFTGRRYKDLLDNLYDIRSVVEHLHGPFRAVTATGERERLLTLGLRAMQAEALARFCLKVVLSDERLWPHFADENAIEAFWALPEIKRRLLWPTRLGVEAVTRMFDSTRHDEVVSRNVASRSSPRA
jgi:hypothetical protein